MEGRYSAVSGATQVGLKQPGTERGYGYCRRCRTFTENCQGPEHRGKTKCMECGGGLADEVNRICVNCVDLPFRRIREAALGRPIIYTTEVETFG